MKHYIRFPRADGTHSRQAHADLPEGTFEREMGKEGFFGPAAHFHHRHPPTAWETFSGALNPHAYDLTRLPATGASPWDATPFMGNGDVKIRHWKTDRAMDHLVRNQDGDELLFVHDGAGELFCDWGHLDVSRRRLPRDPARHDVADCADRADDAAAGRRHRGHVHAAGEGHRRAARDLRSRRARRARDGRGVPRAADRRPVDGGRQAQGRAVDDHAIRSIRWTRWAGMAISASCASTSRDIRPLMSHRYHLPPSAHTTFVGKQLRRLHVRAAADRVAIPARSRCRSSTTTTTTTR